MQEAAKAAQELSCCGLCRSITVLRGEGAAYMLSYTWGYKVQLSCRGSAPILCFVQCRSSLIVGLLSMRGRVCS